MDEPCEYCPTLRERMTKLEGQMDRASSDQKATMTALETLGCEVHTMADILKSRQAWLGLALGIFVAIVGNLDKISNAVQSLGRSLGWGG